MRLCIWSNNRPSSTNQHSISAWKWIKWTKWHRLPGRHNFHCHRRNCLSCTHAHRFGPLALPLWRALFRLSPSLSRPQSDGHDERPNVSWSPVCYQSGNLFRKRAATGHRLGRTQIVFNWKIGVTETIRLCGCGVRTKSKYRYRCV